MHCKVLKARHPSTFAYTAAVILFGFLVSFYEGDLNIFQGSFNIACKNNIIATSGARRKYVNRKPILAFPLISREAATDYRSLSFSKHQNDAINLIQNAIP